MASTLTASRRVGRLIRIASASWRSLGSRSPSPEIAVADALRDLLDGALEGPARADRLKAGFHRPDGITDPLPAGPKLVS